MANIELDDFIDQQLQNLGKRLRQMRKEKGYSSADKFAFQNDIERALYGRYEKGQNMKFNTLMKLLYALDISPAEFFAEGFTFETEEKKSI